jgi:hypothetical protein
MTADILVHLHGVPVLRCAPDGPPLRDGGDVLEVVAAAVAHGARWIAVPAGRLADEFFTLRSGVAGEIVQKFANYRLGLAVVGDVAAHVARGFALRDFVTEANRGRQLWFVTDEGELEQRLASITKPG